MESEINSSSHDHLSADHSKMVVTLDQDATQRALLEEFEARDFQRIDRRTTKDATVLKFKGTRATQTTGGSNTVASTTFGSVFFARIEPVSATETSVLLLGKPTVDGQEMCSDDDWENTTCESKTTGGGWPGLDMMTGREEAETIRSVFLALEDRAETSDTDSGEDAAKTPAPPATNAENAD